MAAAAHAKAKPVWDGGERRGPARAKNVSRLPAPPAAAAGKASATGTDDQWESF